jgi:hypothetical protein
LTQKKFYAWVKKGKLGKILVKSILLKHYEDGNKKKNIHSMSQGLLNPGFMQGKVQKGDFLKKRLAKIEFLFYFRFLRISGRPGMLN